MEWIKNIKQKLDKAKQEREIREELEHQKRVKELEQMKIKMKLLREKANYNRKNNFFSKNKC